VLLDVFAAVFVPMAVIGAMKVGLLPGG
jgi:hypothetical protein